VNEQTTILINQHRMGVKIKNISHSKLKQINHEINHLLIEHNQICATLLSTNRFWKKFFLYNLCSMFPINLCIVQQVLFTQLLIIIRMLFTVTGFVTFAGIFFIIFDAARVYNCVHAEAKNISRLQWSMKGWPYQRKLKWKLLSTFESISVPNLGFSVSSLAIINFPIFYKVKTLFCFRIASNINQCIFYFPDNRDVLQILYINS